MSANPRYKTILILFLHLRWYCLGISKKTKFWHSLHCVKAHILPPNFKFILASLPWLSATEDNMYIQCGRCVRVGQIGELCRNGWADQDAIWRADSYRSKENQGTMVVSIRLIHWQPQGVTRWQCGLLPNYFGCLFGVTTGWSRSSKEKLFTWGMVGTDVV